MEFYELPAEDKRYAYFRHSIIATDTHFHSAIELLFVERGEIVVTLDDETRTLREGDACFADAFTLHTYHFDDPKTSAFVMVGNRTLFDRIFDTLGGVPPKFFRFDDFALLSTLHAFYEQHNENEGGRYAIFDATAQLILSHVSLFHPFVSRAENKRALFVCEVLRYAQENYKDDLSLAALARVFGYSREHLSRIIAKYLRENWNRYIDRIRVLKAHEALQAEPEKTVIEIALEHGFESSNTFYRAYKQEFGEVPRRKQYQ